MDRKEFLTKGASIVGVASIIGSNNAFAQNLTNNNIDKLVDANGNFVLQPLPYAESFLEPYMDSETLHLHHTFHHGGATKAANKDQQMIIKALNENNLSTCRRTFCILFFGQTSATKPPCQKGSY